MALERMATSVCTWRRRTAPGAPPPTPTTSGRSPSSALPMPRLLTLSRMWSTRSSSPSALTSASGTEKTKLLWLGDKDKTLNYSPAADEMVLTVHRWFANKSCPGDWMYARMGDLASKVTAALGDTVTTPKQLYRVRKTWSNSKSQKGAYKILANAKSCADKNPGYSVFDTDGNAVYTSETGSAGVPGDAAFKVRVSVPDLNIRSGPGTNYAATGRFHRSWGLHHHRRAVRSGLQLPAGASSSPALAGLRWTTPNAYNRINHSGPMGEIL